MTADGITRPRRCAAIRLAAITRSNACGSAPRNGLSGSYLSKAVKTIRDFSQLESEIRRENTS